MAFNKDYLIRRNCARAHRFGVRAYSYKACSIMESEELLNGVMTHVVSFRREDCGKYLSREELFGILDSLGMRHDGTMKMEKPSTGHVVYFTQPVTA